jgi:hypothetical protein
MKQQTIAIALLLSAAAVGAAVAASPRDEATSPEAQSQSAPASAPETQAARPLRLAEGFFENLWRGERHGERHGDERGERGDDDDDGGATNASADPNAANAPVPDNGVFTGKARPKVEVQ